MTPTKEAYVVTRNHDIVLIEIPAVWQEFSTICDHGNEHCYVRCCKIANTEIFREVMGDNKPC